MEFSEILEEKVYVQRLFFDCAGKEEVFKSRIMKLEFILENCELSIKYSESLVCG